MLKKYKTRLIKTRESYSSKQISELFKIHIKTVRMWVKEGLPVINKRPILIMGFALKEFLDNKQKNRKCKLKPDEFYCTKCRKSRKSVDNIVWLNLTGKTIGKNKFRQIIIKGACSKCASPLNRFSHEGKLAEIQNYFEVINMEVLDNA